MSKTFDELMKVLEEKGEIADDVAKKVIAEHGALTDDEKKQLAAAIRMKKSLVKKKDDDKAEDKKEDKADKKEDEVPDEVSMDDYLQALSVLDSDDATDEEKKNAEKIKEKFES